MKCIKLVVFCVVFFCSTTNTHAQAGDQVISNPQIINSFNIGVTTNKTTILLFPYSIRSVDRGSSGILVQKAPGTENILQVKAARENFDQTNLSVITADGQLYSFLIDYAKTPTSINFSFLNKEPLVEKFINDQPVQFSDSGLTERQFWFYSNEVLGMKNALHGVKDRSYQVLIKITGIYVLHDQMFFKIKLKNNSNIDYDIEQLRFFIKDQKRGKRTASQENEIKPNFISGEPTTIKNGSENICVFALPKFTIPDKKYFTLEMAEKNGGRFLHIIIHNRTLMKATIL